MLEPRRRRARATCSSWASSTRTRRDASQAFLRRHGSALPVAARPRAARPRSRTASPACPRRTSSTPRAPSSRRWRGPLEPGRDARSTCRRRRRHETDACSRSCARPGRWRRPGRRRRKRRGPIRPQVVGAPRGAALAGAALEARTKEVAALLRCPVCQGLSVADSPVHHGRRTCARQVRDLVAAGYDQEQILAYFERSYGEFVRLAPPLRGVNWLVWLAPRAGTAGRRRGRVAGRCAARAPRRPKPRPRPPADAPGPDTLPDDPVARAVTCCACASGRTAGRAASRRRSEGARGAGRLMDASRRLGLARRHPGRRPA